MTKPVKTPKPEMTLYCEVALSQRQMHVVSEVASIIAEERLYAHTKRCSIVRSSGWKADCSGDGKRGVNDG